MLASGLSREWVEEGPGRGWAARGHREEGTGRARDCRSPRGPRRPLGLAAASGPGGRGRCPSPGGGVAIGALASSCALLTLPPPQPLPRRGCCRVRGPSSPASGLRVVRVCSCSHSGLALALPLPPPSAPLRLLMLVVLQGWDGLHPGQISTCKECPASKLTACPWQTPLVQAVGAPRPDNGVKLSETLARTLHGSPTVQGRAAVRQHVERGHRPAGGGRVRGERAGAGSDPRAAWSRCVCFPLVPLGEDCLRKCPRRKVVSGRAGDSCPGREINANLMDTNGREENFCLLDRFQR